MKALPILATLLAVAALTGCSASENEAPCKDFETAYNSVHLRDKLELGGESGASYRSSLKRLAETANAGADKASRDVRANLMYIVREEARYAATATRLDLDYGILDVRRELRDSFTGLTEACKQSGYSIRLEADHPVS